jgi:hypothetical protein
VAASMPIAGTAIGPHTGLNRLFRHPAGPACLKLVIESLNLGSTDTYDDRSCYMNNVAVI